MEDELLALQKLSPCAAAAASTPPNRRAVSARVTSSRLIGRLHESFDGVDGLQAIAAGRQRQHRLDAALRSETG